MRDDELEQELRPAETTDFGGPGRQRLPRYAVDQRALLERTVDDHGHATLLRQGQDASLGLAVEHIVAHLHEIERLSAHDLLEVAMTPAFGGGYAHIAQLPAGFHGEQSRQMLLPGQ